VPPAAPSVVVAGGVRLSGQYSNNLKAQIGISDNLLSVSLVSSSVTVRRDSSIARDDNAPRRRRASNLRDETAS
jgi:hypothetical protein